ncbi:MAG: pilus assembly protein HicB [Bacteroidaceae bacterium]
MAKKVVVIMEKSSDGYFSCYVDEDLNGFGLAGYGDTAQQAREDMLTAYEEIKSMRCEEGKKTPSLTFEYKYDMQSFFNYFSYLNSSKIAERAGINSSLLRQYISGIKKARQTQYERLAVAIREVAKELSAATL